MQIHLTHVRRFCVIAMKKKSIYPVSMSRKRSYMLFNELQEAERDFIMSIEKHWDSVNKKSLLQQSVLRSGIRIGMARKILHMFGDIPSSIH